MLLASRPPTHCIPAALALLAAGCGPAMSSGGANSEQQSLAEYDLARDAYEKGKLREALAHVEKALDLDDTNADAAYLGAVLMTVGFCASNDRSSDCRYDEAEKFAR